MNRLWEIPHRLDPDLVGRYNRRVPRYTSYPTALQFKSEIDFANLLKVQTPAERTSEPLTVYVHVPFCRKKCLYCGCHSTVCEDTREVQRYLRVLLKEIQQTASMLQPGRKTAKIAFGGGSPAELGPDGLARVVDTIFDAWPPLPGRELAIELDPRTANAHLLDGLVAGGFNRFSFGVQDFDEQVLDRVGRPQPARLTREAVLHLRRLAARASTPVGINFDLLYGLPGQTRETWRTTLGLVREMAPDRLAVFPYAHVPWIKPHQKKLERWGLPGAQERLELFRQSLSFFQKNGYLAVGMDHFARPTDPLAEAAANGTLYRDFMGYSPGPELDLVGIGASSIWWTEGAYSQNHPDTETYADLVIDGKRPVFRGLILNQEDRLRRNIIQQLTCQFRLDTEAYSILHGIDFAEHYAEELEALKPLEADGFVRWNRNVLTVTDLGRLFVRCVCEVFDQYLDPAPITKKHSTAL